MKKLSTGIAALVLGLGLAACDNQGQQTGQTGQDPDLNQMESPSSGGIETRPEQPMEGQSEGLEGPEPGMPQEQMQQDPAAQPGMEESSPGMSPQGQGGQAPQP